MSFVFVAFIRDVISYRFTIMKDENGSRIYKFACPQECILWDNDCRLKVYTARWNFEINRLILVK